MEGAATAAASSAVVVEEERLHVLNKTEEKFIEMEITTEQFTCGCTPKARKLLLQRRADCKDSWPDQWYISSAGHISAGDSSLVSAQRELQEELGISLPKYAFELIFIYLQECVINDGKFINNEFNDVYLVTTVDPIPREAFTLQETEVSAVKYILFEEYRSLLVKEDPDYVPYDVDEQYGHLFEIIRRSFEGEVMLSSLMFVNIAPCYVAASGKAILLLSTEHTVACSLSLQKQLCRYASVSLDAELTGLSNTDRKTLGFLIKAAKLMDEIFYLQVWYSNPALRDWLKEHASASELDKLKWMYYSINKSPWSCLDENEAFLTTTDSAIKLLPEATKPVSGWKGLEYKAAFPMLKPPGANFYSPDMDKREFKLLNDSLKEKEQIDAMGFFTVIKRHSEFSLDSSSPYHAVHGTNHLMTAHDLYSVPYSKEYNSFLGKAAELLHEAGDLAGSPSLNFEEVTT
ncbi:hypothetical protein NC653_009650 [Populus alba x Populus x berolinensis]|uniref:Nudix hydrolase domain-containing protein n=1 Tax=Populus alba x Populus x berolinensis TaxID=444605 RepID=A0AAD6RA25_9ROSI|nr:hypothetical protein NC653_009650 [Populus alba x Populus x berolinensis]